MRRHKIRTHAGSRNANHEAVAVRFCPFCGAQLEVRSIDGRERGACDDCWFAEWGHHEVGIGAVVVNDDNRVLLGRWNETASKGLWGLPSGFVEADEVLHNAVEREVREELAVDVEARQIVAVRSIVGERSTSIYIVFKAQYLVGKPVADQIEFTEARWFTRDELKTWTDITTVTRDVAVAVLDDPHLGLGRRPYQRANGDPADLHLAGSHTDLSNTPIN